MPRSYASTTPWLMPSLWPKSSELTIRYLPAAVEQPPFPLLVWVTTISPVAEGQLLWPANAAACVPKEAPLKMCPETRLGSPTTTMARANSFPSEARLNADRRGRMGEVAAGAGLRCDIGMPLDFTISAMGGIDRKAARDSPSVGERLPPVKRPIA